MNEAARPAGPKDAPFLVALAKQARDEKADARGGDLLILREAKGDVDAAHIEAILADPLAEAIVGTIDGTVIGYALIASEALADNSRLARIDELYVMPGAREVGVGAAIMNQLEATARSWGCRGLDAIALPGDRATKNFFETFGMVARGILVHRVIDTDSK